MDTRVVQREGRSVKMSSGGHRPSFVLVALKGGCVLICDGLYNNFEFCACKGLFREDFLFFRECITTVYLP